MCVYVCMHACVCVARGLASVTLTLTLTLTLRVPDCSGEGVPQSGYQAVRHPGRDRMASGHTLPRTRQPR
jgi:hypothetical protein